MCRECGCGPFYPMEPHRHPYGRHFLTKEEKIKRLESYAEELKKELSAVEERIKELRE